MRLEYTITIQDLREAFAMPRQRRDLVYANFVFFAVPFALAIAIAGGWMGQEPMATLTAAAAAPAQDLWVTLAPPLVGLTLFVGGTLSSRWRAQREGQIATMFGAPGRINALFTRTDVLWIVALGWMVLPNIPALAIPWHPTHLRTLWAAVAPWFAYGIFSSFVLLTQPRQLAAVLSVQARSLKRQSIVDVSDDGITNADEKLDVRYRWAYFVSYRETINLIVLYTEDGGPFILPKRAFPDSADQAALRMLVHSHIARGSFLPRSAAFPVAVIPVPDEPNSQ